MFSAPFLSDYDFKDNVLNRALSSLHGGLLQITLTVPFRFSTTSESDCSIQCITNIVMDKNPLLILIFKLSKHL